MYWVCIGLDQPEGKKGCMGLSGRDDVSCKLMLRV